jgi:nucleoid-associated protein YgaU
MATLMAIAPLPDRELLDALTAPRPPLRLLSNPGESRRAADPGAHVASASPAGRPRLRRTGLFVLVVGLLGALAVPVSALAGTGATTAATLTQGSTYVVQPGDTLWSIATRLDPTGDPRSIVGQLASETGSDTVVVGEHIRLP